jgi:hypothetical protein
VQWISRDREAVIMRLDKTQEGCECGGAVLTWWWACACVAVQGQERGQVPGAGPRPLHRAPPRRILQHGASTYPDRPAIIIIIIGGRHHYYHQRHRIITTIIHKPTPV